MEVTPEILEASRSRPGDFTWIHRGKPVVHLTPAAWLQVWEAIRDQGSKDGPCYLRVGVRGGGCSGFEYQMDVILGAPDPKRDLEWGQVEPQGEVRIAVDPVSAQYLRGTTIDWVKRGLQEGFAFTNPNAKRSCGCGKSFSTE